MRYARTSMSVRATLRRMFFRQAIRTAALIPFCAISLLAAVQTANNSARGAGSNANEIRLDSSAVILLAPNTPAPVQKATEDLRSDFAKVFGKKLRIVTTTEE